MGSSIILGIDPSSTLTGFAALDMDAGKMSSLEPFAKVLHLEEARIYGRTDHDKILDIGNKVEERIQKFQPYAVAIEGGYVGENPNTALFLGALRGAVIYVARRHTCYVFQGQPREIRCGIGITGKQKKRAEGKLDVLERIVQLLRLTTCPRENAADAAATAIWGGLKLADPVPF